MAKKEVSKKELNEILKRVSKEGLKTKGRVDMGKAVRKMTRQPTKKNAALK